MRGPTNVYTICGFAALGSLLFGMDISSMAGVIGTLAYKDFFGYPASITQGYITASMPAGSVLGTVVSSILSDRYSRKVAIQISCILWIIGSAIQAGSNGIPTLCCGRAVSGLGVGIVSAVVPVYQAEIAPKEIRGRMIALHQWAITWGILIQYFVQYGCSFIGDENDIHQATASFRIPWALQMIPAWILLIGLFWMPHSPRWLASRDRWDEAIQILAKIHAGGNLSDAKVLAQYREIEEALRFEKEARAAGWGALLEPAMAKRVALGMSVQMWSELSGVNVMMYYIVYIMEGARIATPLLTASIQYIINVALTLPALIYLDRWGRRPTLLIGAIGMLCCHFVSGILQGKFGEPIPKSHTSDLTWHIVGNPAVSKGVVACSYLFVATYATTWGPTSWTYSAEIFPTKVRAKAVSLSTATNWTVSCILAFAVPPLLSHINWKMYMIFGTFNACAFIQVYFTIPETKNITLEEMDEVFAEKPWRPRQKQSRLEELEHQIIMGDIHVVAPKKQSGHGEESDSKPIMVETVIEMTNERRSSRGSSAHAQSEYYQV